MKPKKERKDMSKKDTLKALCTLQLAYGNEFTDERLDFYVTKLQDINPQLLFAAVNKIEENYSRLPSIADLRKACESISQTATGEHEPSPDEAWGTVMKAVKDTVRGQHPRFSDSAIEETVKNMGWETIYDMLETEKSAVRKHFCDFYANAAKRNRENKQNTKLIENVVGKNKVSLLTGKVLENKTLKKPISQTEMGVGKEIK